MSAEDSATKREIIGILGSVPGSGNLLSQWHAYADTKHMNVGFSRYPANVSFLPERLSEMFHFDRRVYIVAPALAQPVCELLDTLDEQAKQNTAANIIYNRNGVLEGHYVPEEEIFEWVLSILESIHANSDS